jgi:hypothetical protein
MLDVNGNAFVSMWAGLGSKLLQIVLVNGIDHFVEAFLLEPKKYEGQDIGLASD